MMRMLKRKKKLKTGFTLLEIILVMVILSILMSIANPRFSKTNKSLVLREAAESAAAQLNYARELSVIRNSPLVFYYDNEKHETIVARKKENADSENEVLNGKSDKQRNKIPEKIEIKTEPEIINFYPSGTLDPFKIFISDGECQILLQNEGYDGIISQKESRK